MVNHLFRILNLVLIITISTQISLSQNKRIVIGEKNKNNLAHEAIIVSEDSKTISIQFQLNQVDLLELKTDQGNAYVVKIDNAPNILKAGLPDIPYLTQSIVIPDKGKMKLKVIPGKYLEYSGFEVLPSKGNISREIDPSSVPYIKGEIYEKDSFFPKDIAKLREPYILRDLRGQSIDVYPVQYNPASKTLRFYQEITVEITYIDSLGVNELKRNEPEIYVDREFSEIYRDVFLNFNESKYNPLEEEGELLVITFDDFEESITPFVNWKRTIGRKTEIVKKSQIGSTSEDIKEFITDYYYNSGKKLAYVLLVGDAPQIPTMYIEGSGDSDNAYGYIEGNDSYNEVFVGRFSAENKAHVETQVKKVIHYEKDLGESDVWLKLGLGVSRNEGEGNGHLGEADYQHIDFIRDTLLNYTYNTVYQEYDGDVPGINNTNASLISQRINSGVGVINYCNHGAVSGWSVANYNISNVSALSNVGKLPIVWAVACVNGDFVNNFCFAEAWLRATSNGEPSGAIGAMMSSINQPWQPPMTGQDEMVGILSESFNSNTKRTFGGVSINGSMKMLDIHGSSGKETHDTWVLFGDPTLQLRTDTPQKIEVSYSPTITVGSSAFEVQCNAEDALVSVSYLEESGNVVLLGTATVDHGTALVNFDSPLSILSELTIAVTGYNKETFIGTADAIYGDYPFVVVKSFEPTSTADYGNTVSMNLLLQNLAKSPYTVTDVSGQISSESNYVNIISDSFNAGSIQPNQEILLSSVFEIEIAANVPDQALIEFEVKINGAYEEDTFEWTQKVVLIARAPILSIEKFTIDDFGEGLPGILDAGESASIIFDVFNLGHAVSPDVSISFYSSSEYIDIQGESEIFIDPILVGNTVNVPFSFVVSAQTPELTVIPFVLVVEAGEYSISKEIEIVLSQVPDYKIENNVVTGCVGKFYDSGGEDNDYANNEAFIFTINPLYEGKNVKVLFENFDVEENDDCSWDHLMVFDGPNTDSPFIAKLCGTNPPESISATGGPLTFYFVSDGYITESGWVANFTCANATQEVTLHVVDDKSMPIEGALVRVEDTEFFTNAEGVITFETNSNQMLDWLVTKEGYQPASGIIELYDVPLEQTIVMYTGFNVEFNVVNSQNIPVVGADVTLTGQETRTTDFEGYAVFTGLYSDEQITYTISHNQMHMYEGVIETIHEDLFLDITLIPLDTKVFGMKNTNIYPNPFSDVIHIDQLNGIVRIEILNEIGQLVLSTDLPDLVSHNIDCKHLSPGLYLVNIFDRQGKVYSKKLVKK